MEPAPHAWYRDAVFYEVMIRGFQDSDGDGIGDLPGLINRLDHLNWLGVDCIWLLPFYRSPLRDNGYDISDYLTVHEDFGKVDDVARLLEETHRRGMRVIADLVVNHTSDQHPWFLESRTSRTNSRADWYVWHDDDELWSEARIIFVDTEPSNWTWCDQREQFYWHRFFAHQPDLNFDCPEVSEAMFDVMGHWLGMGLDGFRLDAVPYLFERDGTNGENLPQTHVWLRELRRRVDESYPGRVLLAEANQPPRDVVDYFGSGDECHMVFHFPLMPRMFKSLRDHRADTIEAALADTPPVPDGCQWGVFLRNHDELTLEMVTDEERSFMYRHYAPEPGMRRNVGIGRRLFPLVDDDRRQAELLHSLLLSMPGSPVLYYGDEIGMGERIELGDRDPVRTPMQWDSTPNGGFSTAPAESVYLPSIDEGPYGYPTRNVAVQRQDPHSFLRWLRDMLLVRHEIGIMGTADYEPVVTGHPSVFGFVRHGDGRSVLCLTNLLDAPSVAMPDVGVAGLEPLALAAGATVDVTTVSLPAFGWAWCRIGPLPLEAAPTTDAALLEP
ncbi:MAG TPA: maltose alpha-D-glucosyltransferase [Microthrixaceae bacterium]|nr:maltose alpha-D-glucosyltransferase [Microthrixaceae bacterium]